MATAWELLRTDDLLFAELEVAVEDDDWGEDNDVTRPIVALPSTPVWQTRDRGPRTLLNANHAVFHHAGTGYRRERFRDVPYRCLFFFPAPGLVREVQADVGDLAGADGDVVRFPAPAFPLGARAFALSRLAARAARLGGDGAVEPAYEALRQAIASTVLVPPGRATDGGTVRAHRELVEEAKEVLTARFAEGVSLGDLAERLHVSPYHLARVFRSGTGFSVHGYLVHLRLRAGFDRLRSGAAAGRVGQRVGFSTPSHFTAAFHRAFGLTPSAFVRG